jgi:hypothetical protein
MRNVGSLGLAGTKLKVCNVTEKANIWSEVHVADNYITRAANI